MSDSLAERLRKMAAQSTADRTAEADVTSRQVKVNAFIAEQAEPEYQRLLEYIRTRIEELNPEIGDLPKFQMIGQRINQGNYVARVLFDKPILNMPNNQLLVSIGPNPNSHYFLTEPPQTLRYRLQAAATDAIEGIVWVGDLGELTTAQLGDFLLEALTGYYLDNVAQR